MWVVHAQLVRIGLITIRHEVVNFMVVLRGYLRQSFSSILPEEGMRDSLKMVVLSL